MSARRAIDDDVELPWGEKRERRCCLIVFNTNGSLVAAYYPPLKSELYDIVWSPDSRRIAAMQLDLQFGVMEASNSVIAYDVAAKQVQTLISGDPDRAPAFESWIEGGKAVLYVEWCEGANLYRKLYLDGSPSVEYESRPRELNPDKLRGIPFNISRSDEGMTVKDLTTGKTICTLPGVRPYEVRPIPRTRFVEYERTQTIQDASGKELRIDSLWLMYPEGAHQNRMCVALGAARSDASWSDDCLTLAYKSKGRAFAVDIKRRKAAPREKIAGGMRVTEEEARTVALENANRAKQIWNNTLSGSERYPTEDQFAYAWPGPDRSTATYFKPDDEYHLGNPPPPDTILALIDVGYPWQIAVYGDDRIEEVLK